MSSQAATIRLAQKDWLTNCDNERQIDLLQNIAKGTTDPRVEFISHDHSAQFTKLEHITNSESRLSINF